nr:hypothetical protein [Tanacetum cinerariifolium]
MFEVSTILEDGSAKLVSGGLNGFVIVSLSNYITSSLCGSSTFVELIGGDEVSLFGEILGEGASLSMVVEEDAQGVFVRSRVAVELGVDTTLRDLKYSSSIVVPVFQKGDDLIDAIIHMMSFLTAVVTSRYPPTNSQLRNSSNPRQQTTINNGRVTIQPIQGRQNSLTA